MKSYRSETTRATWTCKFETVTEMVGCSYIERMFTLPLNKEFQHKEWTTILEI